MLRFQMRISVCRNLVSNFGFHYEFILKPQHAWSIFALLKILCLDSKLNEFRSGLKGVGVPLASAVALHHWPGAERFFDF